MKTFLGMMKDQSGRLGGRVCVDPVAIVGAGIAGAAILLGDAITGAMTFRRRLASAPQRTAEERAGQQFAARPTLGRK